MVKMVCSTDDGDGGSGNVLWLHWYFGKAL